MAVFIPFPVVSQPVYSLVLAVPKRRVLAAKSLVARVKMAACPVVGVSFSVYESFLARVAAVSAAIALVSLVAAVAAAAANITFSAAWSDLAVASCATIAV